MSTEQENVVGGPSSTSADSEIAMECTEPRNSIDIGVQCNLVVKACLTVDLARKAHRSPGRLVDEDGLRGLPLVQRIDRSGSEGRGLPCVGACSPPGTYR